MRKTTIVFCTLCLFLTVQISQLLAQNRTIRGTVVNGITSKPIEGLSVRVQGTDDSTRTNAVGAYILTIPDTLKTIIFMDFTGMELMEVKKIGDDKINIYLSDANLLNLSFEDLFNIKIVTASKNEQTISKAPATIAVITAKQIDDRGYQSVGEALGCVAGMYPLNDYMQYNVGIRGVNGGMRAWSRIIKVMINGQAVSFRPSSEAFLGEELIPMSAIERIEIIKGPASALYGANAYLGVINIITKKSNKQVSGEITGKYADGTNVNGQGGELFANGKLNNFNYLVSSSYSNYNRFKLHPVDVPGYNKYATLANDNDISNPTSFYSKIDYNHGKGGDISFDFNYQNLNTSGEFQDWGAVTHNNRTHQINYYSRIKYEKELFDNFKTNASITHSKSMLGPDDKLDIDTTSTSWITRKVGCNAIDIVVNMDYTFTKESTIKIGLDFTNENNDLLTYYLNQIGKVPQPQQGISFGDTTFRNTGVFLQSILSPSEILHMHILKKLGITCGLRYDMHNIYGNVFNYRLAGVYSFSNYVYIKLLYGTSFKAPSAAQLYSNYIAVGDVIGNPDLKPERARTLELTTGIKPHKSLSITSTIFYNIINDKVELILPYGTISNVSYDNVAKITSAGAEIEAIHNYKNLMSYINFSYQRSILSKENLTGDQIKIKTELYPDVILKGGTNLAIPPAKINVNIEGQYVTNHIASQQNNYKYDAVNFRTLRYELPAYFIMNMAVSTREVKIFKNRETRLMLKANNLLNTEGAWPGFRDFDIPFGGRNIVISLTQKF